MSTAHGGEYGDRGADEGWRAGGFRSQRCVSSCDDPLAGAVHSLCISSVSQNPFALLPKDDANLTLVTLRLSSNKFKGVGDDRDWEPGSLIPHTWAEHGASRAIVPVAVGVASSYNQVPQVILKNVGVRMA